MPSTSEGQSSGDPGGYVYRDRDPPPSWNGSTPEVSFKTWLRDLELWEATTDIPKEKRAIKLVQALTGPAREAVSSLTLAELQHADGYKTVMKVLNDNFKPYVETALPRAMEGVFYGQARGAKESIPDYLVRASHALAELKAEGVDLPAKAAGYLLFRQANLDKELESRVVTWLAGDYTKDVVIANLRRLDRINSSSSGSKAMLWTETEEGEGQEVYYENHEHYGEPEFYLEAEDEEDENYVYLEDGELDAVYEEGDVMEALASYQHVRQQLKEQQKGRQYYQPNLGKKGGKKLFNKDGKNTGKQSSKSFGKGGSAWKGSPTSRRVHIEQLKLRTRCRACGEVGHWSKECRHRAGPSLTTSSSSSGPGASRGSFYWAGRTDGGSGGANTFLSFGQFLNDRPGESMAGELFVGVTTQGCHGLVDTAAQEGLVGRPALLRLLDLLRPLGLKGCWTDKATQARGIGGAAKTVGVCEVPIGLGGVPGVLELTVVAEDVPLLLPVSLLRALGSVIDLSKDKITFSKVNGECNMTTLPSGHAAVDVLDFGPEGWVMPSACAGRRMESDFRTGQVFGSRPKTTRSPKTLKSEAYASFSLAVRNWRVLLDKLCSLLAWGYWQTVVSPWLSLPGPESQQQPSPTDTTSPATLTTSSATSRGQIYKNYLEGERPEQLASVKGVPTQEIGRCAHPAQQLKGGGNGHMNWFHCNLCKARWKLSPRTAGALTGRPVETVNQSKEKTLNLAENALKQQEKRMAQKHQMQQLADERARSDELQTTLDLREGEYLEFERAVENVTAMEAHLSEMDPTTANQVQAMVSEFKRVQRYEQETRHRANTLPLRETKSDWEQAVATMKQAVDMVNQNVNVGQNIRSWDGTRVLQSATPNMVRRWMAKPLPFLDDFVVVSKNGVLQRMDRQDVEGLHSLEDEEVYVVVKEPELYLEHLSAEMPGP
ncbi:C15C7.7 [Symbiodinium natans]|uniref:C15C7.7 protein n=1 Tax=Symbiodinium natans TaxID=878477 RepID=A0A812UNL3_9DINO|nr:C15C7.7 [Symbiodinium natans]